MVEFRRNASSWAKYVEDRLCNLILLRKFDLSASGTSVFAFYTSVPAAPGDLWGVSGLNLDEAMVQAAWLNSTPNLLQMFLSRTETRGAWMKVDANTLDHSLFLNSSVLDPQQRKAIMRALAQISSVRCPSILSQLEQRFAPRKVLDASILSAIGFGKSEIDTVLESMYTRLASEIRMLRTLMEGSARPLDESVGSEETED
jgi:hypothetical protein